VQLTSRCAVVALLSLGFAGCSTDVGRFNEPMSNPFAYSAPNTPPSELTGSVAEPSMRAPSGQVTSQALPPSGGQSQYGQQPNYGNTLPPPPARNYRSSAVSPSTPMTSGAAAPSRPAQASGVHVVASGDTLSSISRSYGKSRADIAAANNIAPDTQVRIGQRLAIPGTQQSQIKTAAVAAPTTPAAQRGAPERNLTPPPVPSTLKPTAAAKPAEPVRTASLEPVATARLATPAAESAAEASADAPSVTGATPTFRWPARGRVIAGFGAKPNGQQNDGINLSVPEGTSIKAAEDGVVAYAGNELKGYGNLVLVRHSNGYVTAYAHASELSVKRGEQVKRGQIIAKAGQTGSVTSPQLHFEIRKGSSPVDPMQYLAGT
jgi:murein DD-endopeptidase MepM/ murein hydrolase activator NlpD